MLVPEFLGLYDEGKVYTTLVLTKNFIQETKIQFYAFIRVLRSENGLKFVNNDLSAFIQSLGVSHQTSCVKTRQQIC